LGSNFGAMAMGPRRPFRRNETGTGEMDLPKRPQRC
jgi:hypothetical protein